MDGLAPNFGLSSKAWVGTFLYKFIRILAGAVPTSKDYDSLWENNHNMWLSD